MKILYFISVMSHGRGGHAHSLNHISRELGKNHEVGIVSIGVGRSQVIEQNPFFIGHISFKGYNYFSFSKQFKTICMDFNADILHFFDPQSYNAASLVPGIGQYKVVVSKCGGANPADFPYADNLVLFSKENEEWFKSNSKFKNTKLYVIPNRVRSVDKAVVPSLNEFTDAFTFMRIARIGKSYKKSIADSIRLVMELNQDSNNTVKLIIVGTIQDPVVYKDLLDFANNDRNILFLVEDNYTQEASKLLHMADAVIATGRGIMEASSIGKPILTPARNSTLPVLITENNFESFFRTNFSERNQANSKDKLDNFSRIQELVSDNNAYERYSSFSKKVFSEYFDISLASSKYIEVYEYALSNSNKRSNFDDIILRIGTVISFLKSTIKKELL